MANFAYIGIVLLGSLFIFRAFRPNVEKAGMSLSLFQELNAQEQRYLREKSMELLASAIERPEPLVSIEEVSRLGFLPLLQSEKKEMISKSRKELTKDSVRLLKLSLQDAEYDIRFLAATALSDLEQVWRDKLSKEKNVQAKLDLYLEAFHANLFSPSMGAFVFKDALRIAKLLLREDPTNDFLKVTIQSFESAGVK